MLEKASGFGILFKNGFAVVLRDWIIFGFGVLRRDWIILGFLEVTLESPLLFCSVCIDGPMSLKFVLKEVGATGLPSKTSA